MKYLWITTLLFICVNAISQNILRGPYLQMGTSTSMVVKWRTDVGTDSRVWYGTDINAINNLASIVSVATDHEVTISGLMPNQKYYYVLADSNGNLTTTSEDFTFVTAPATGTSQAFRAWILGDCGTKNDDARAVRDAYYDYVGNEHTDAILMLGDNAYGSGTDAQYQDAVFENMYEDLLQKSVLWSCPGNHDYYSTGAMPYYNIFTFPTNGEAGGLPSGTEAYYSFDYGNIHFISLDSHDTPKDVGDPMLVWLENDLNATNQDWIVVIFHHPPYTRGSHDSDNLLDSNGYMRDMRENVLPILEDGGVDLVLSGHSHCYERSYLMKGHYGFSNTLAPSMILDDGNGRINGDGAYDKALTGTNAGDGAIYITAGSSGKATGGDLDHPIMYYSLNRLGSISLEICGNQLDLKFINDYGVVDDYFSIVKDDYINQPPTVNITSPMDSTYYQNPQNIVINAEALDGDGTIQQVEFLLENQVIGTDIMPPYELAWTIPESGSYNIYARAVDNDGNKVTDQITIQADTLCTCGFISKDEDDAEQNLADNSMYLESSDLEFGYDFNNQMMGLRFTRMHIPQGAKIHEAKIQFTVDEVVNDNPALFNILGEDTDNAQEYSLDTNNINIRPKTSTVVAWLPTDWLQEWERGPAQLTPNLSPIVQEIVDRPGFNENSALAFMIYGSGKRVAKSFDGRKDYAPKLCVKYRLCEPATPCDDGDACTTNDIFDANCNCVGTLIDVNNDSICDNQQIVNLSLKTCLSGAYDAATNLMRDDLRTLNLLPTIDPYLNADTLNTTLLTNLTGNDAIVDWVLVELRDSLNSATIIETKAALIQRDGDIVDAILGDSILQFNATNAAYYVAIRHRNHLGVMTANSVGFDGNVQSIDFKDVQTPLWGNFPTLEANGIRQLWSSNTNNNQDIIFQGISNDINPIFFNVLSDTSNIGSNVSYVATNYCEEDVNMDGRVIYQGINNDANFIFFTILTHPSNTSGIPNLVIQEQLP